MSVLISTSIDSINIETKCKPKTKLVKRANKGEISTYENFVDCCRQGVQVTAITTALVPLFSRGNKLFMIC